jgi:hypothetical protein
VFVAEIDDYEARARLTALGWTIEPVMFWPEAECIPGIAWMPPGEWDTDAGTWETYERFYDGPLPPIPDKVLETLA